MLSSLHGNLQVENSTTMINDSASHVRATRRTGEIKFGMTRV